jgi:hypothetical protein
VIESVWLSGAAVTIAGVIASLLLALVKAQGSAYIPRLDEVVLSAPVIAWLAGLGALSAMILTAGALVTAAGGGSHLDRALRPGGRANTASRATRRLRHGLIAAEFAITLPLIVAAVLVTTSLLRLSRVPVGIETSSLLTMGVSLSGQRYVRMRAEQPFGSSRSRGSASCPASKERPLPTAVHREALESGTTSSSRTIPRRGARASHPRRGRSCRSTTFRRLTFGCRPAGSSTIDRRTIANSSSIVRGHSVSSPERTRWAVVSDMAAAPIPHVLRGRSSLSWIR